MTEAEIVDAIDRYRETWRDRVWLLREKTGEAIWRAARPRRRAAASDRAGRAVALRPLRRERRAGHRGSVAVESARDAAARLLRELVDDVR